MIYLYTGLAIAFIIILYQDLKLRAIHISLPVIIMTIALIINYYTITLNVKDTLLNFSFIGINILGLFLYMSYKAKKAFNPVNTVLGLGDILFFLAITPLFTLKEYILFFIAGLVFSLIIHLISARFYHSKSIPLAGYLSLFFIINLWFNHILNNSLLHIWS